MMTLVKDAGEMWIRTRVPTPVGSLTVVYAGPAVVAASFEDAGTYWFGRSTRPGPPPAWLTELVSTALSDSFGSIAWTLVDPGVTELEARALAEATRIPFGETRAYGEVASLMGYPGRARLVGRAMSRSPASLLIPTHRVIRADGRPSRPERGGMAERLRRYEQACRAGATRSPDLSRE